MTRLLNANFARLFKSKLFRICAAISALYGIGMIVWNRLSTSYGSFYSSHSERNLFDSVIIIMMAVFICLFIGQEYGGALRNKIIVGKTRLSIYLANLITCLAAATIFYILFASFLLITVVFFGGILVLPPETMALHLLLQLLSILCASAVFTALAMLIHHKYLSGVVALVLFIGLFMAEMDTNGRMQRLNQDIMSADEAYKLGMIDDKEQYIDELLSEKESLKIAFTINPIGQQTQLGFSYKNEILRIENPERVTDNDPAPVHIIPYSLGIIAVSTAVGILVFRKKDLR